jgi:hypothetical protein
MNQQTAEKVKETRSKIQGLKKEVNALAQDSALDTTTRNELDRAYGRLSDAEHILERATGDAARAHTA